MFHMAMLSPDDYRMSCQWLNVSHTFWLRHFFLIFAVSEGTWKRSKEKFPYSMTLHRNVRSFGANNQGQGWEKQVFLTQSI